MAAVEVELSLKPAVKTVGEITVGLTEKEKMDLAAEHGVPLKMVEAFSKYFKYGGKASGKPQGSGAKGGKMEDKKCFYCDKPGHFARDCILKKKEEAKKGKEGKEKGKEKKKDAEKPKPKKPVKKWVKASDVVYDQEDDRYVFDQSQARSVEEPSEQVEN